MTSAVCYFKSQLHYKTEHLGENKKLDSHLKRMHSRAYNTNMTTITRILNNNFAQEKENHLKNRTSQEDDSTRSQLQKKEYK